MRRFPDWPQRLQGAITERRSWAYAWGQFDCALCGADLVAAVTGQDFGAPFRGRYQDEAGAQAILTSLGHSDLADLLDSCLPRRAESARRADVVLQPHPAGAFIGTIWGGGVIGPSPRGLSLVPRDPNAPVWSVG